MSSRIKLLKMNLISCENKKADEELKKDVKLFDEEEARVDYLSGIIEFTSEKSAGKNNFSIIYKNYQKLDFLRDLYEDSYPDNEKKFKSEFKKAAKLINDSTKAYSRYSRWSRVFDNLPTGSYLSCTIPNSYWRLISKDNFNKLMSKWEE
jgi:hypothetical protein